MPDKENERDLWHLFTARFAVPMLTASLGFGGSQLLAVQTIRDRVLFNTQHLEHLDKIIASEHAERIQADFENRAQHVKAMAEVTGLLEKVVQQSTEVITLIKVQQQMKGAP